MKVYDAMVIRGLKRRKKEMRYVSAAAFFAMLFLASVTLFQNVMDRYLMETNYQNYGEWVLSAVEDFQGKGVLFAEPKHPYFAQSGVCRTGGMLLDEEGMESGVCIGTVDEPLCSFGNITLYEGRFPETADEIAMDLSSLSALGYSYELGQKIQVRIREGKEIRKKEFSLTGTVRSFASNWKHEFGYFLPNGIVTEEGLSSVGEPLYATHFYRIDRAYENLNMQEFAGAFLKAGHVRSYNSYVYENRVWGSRELFLAVEVLLVSAGALAVGYLMMSYVSQRRRWYYRLRCTGANKRQIRRMIGIEILYGTFPWAAAGMLFPYAVGATLCYMVSEKYRMPYFFSFYPKVFVRQAGTALGVILFVTVCAWFEIRDKRIGQNRQPVTDRQIRRLRRDIGKGKHMPNRFLKRQRKLHPWKEAGICLFSLTVGLILTTGFCKMYQAQREYDLTKKEFHDFKAGCRKEICVRSQSGNFSGSSEGMNYDMYHGMDVWTEEEMRSLIGVEKQNLQTWDQTHILQWERKKDSPVEEAKKRDYEHDAVNSILTTQFHYLESGDEELESLKEEKGLEDLDWEAFEKGEEIVLLLFDYVSLVDARSVKETTIHPDDFVQIVSAEKSLYVPVEMEGYDLPGSVSVKVGAVVENPSFSWMQKFQYTATYGVVASKRLAERVVLADGKELRNNQVVLTLNKNQSFESTQKRLASIFEKNGMEYDSGREKLQEARNAYIRKMCIYGAMLGMIFLVFLVLQVHFLQMQNQYRSKEYRLFEQLGSKRQFLRRMAVKESLRQAAWIFLAALLAYVGQAAEMYLRNQREKAQWGMQVWSQSLGDYTSDLCRITADQMKEYGNIWALLIFTGVLMASVIGIWYRLAVKQERR